MKTKSNHSKNLKSVYFLCLLITLVALTQPTYSQSPEVPLPEAPKTKDRIVVGGSGWLTLGNSMFIELLPVVGYRLTNRFSVLAGPMYSYFHDYAYDYSDNIYGGRAMARFFPINNLFLQAEIDNMSYGVKGISSRSNSTLTMVGAGYYNFGSTLEIMYITNRPANAKFLNPFIVRVGFIFYLSDSK
ncbi:MAG: hypothetical protein LC109_12875 [Bacteroidia bacterium]|nr:hypothetical protein [Bacteroidia bacterium]MCO5253013.1 hypothetical protein [Bacteroidota bacterium]MCZ2131143.1 hypothetical protein [Bacteroidia bacterium]